MISFVIPALLMLLPIPRLCRPPAQRGDTPPQAPGRPPMCLLILIALAIAGATNQIQAQAPVLLPLGSNFQEIVDAHPPGTKYVVSAGIHRAATLVPKDGDVISGEPGAVLNGCVTLNNWEFDGQWWFHTVPVLVAENPPAGTDCADMLCLQTQDFYLDGVRLKPVSALAGVVTPNEWYLDRAAGRVYLMADPTGLLAELGGDSRTAIDCAPVGRPQAFGVVIEDLTITQYPCPLQIGAVRLAGGGIIRRCAVTASHSYGIQLMNAAALVQNCYLADNGMCGIGGTGIGATIEGCEIAYNVWPLYAGLAWDNGGVKIAGSRETVFRRNYIHHNFGPGLWWDIKTTLLTIEDNIIESNHWEGILMEISEQAIIRRNICRWNGVQHRRALWGAQICVQNGSSAQIHDNYLETGRDFNSPTGSRQGIMVINQVDRAWDEGVFQGDFGVHEIDVHDNLLVMPSGGHNGVDYGTLGWDTYEDFLNAGLVWKNNRYLVGQPLNHRWSWRREPNWDATVGKWLVWEDWATIQDVGSTLESIGPNDYPPSGVGQHALIKETTGHDYTALKAELTRRPALSPTDRDADGLPDEWERLYFPALGSSDATSDPDSDGWTNAEERTAGSNPRAADTDSDGLNDSWEGARGLNPLVYDSHLDPDADGRSILEEQADGTNLATPEPLDLPAPEPSLSFWLTPTSQLATDEEGNLTEWFETSSQRLRIGWFGTPHAADPTPTDIPLIDPGDMLLVPGAEGRWGTAESGFTLSFIFQPTVIDTSREWGAVLTNEVYQFEGFRLRLESGYLVMSAGQSGGSLVLAGHTRLTADEPHLITLTVAPNGQGGALYLDGRLEASSTSGFVVPSTAALMLGNTNGVPRQPGLFGDIILFRRHLSHQERRSLETFLQQKFVSGVPISPDRDRDGLPDDWETTAGLDTLTPNALADEDEDGASNWVEYQQDLDPSDPDTDADGMPDGWEIEWDTDPLQDDAADDPDEDGLSNAEEYENRTDPKEPDLQPPFLSFNRFRLWWRADHGLESDVSGFARWLDSSPTAHHGTPQVAGTPLAEAPTLWAGHKVLRLSDNALVTAAPIATDTLLHPKGVTFSMAVRPIPEAQPAGFRRLMAFGDLVVGIDDNRLVLRNQSGSVSVTSSTPLPASPFVLSGLVGPPQEPSRLLVNSTVAVEAAGLDFLAPATLSLGGPDAWIADVAEIVVHAGLLAPLNRRFAESILRAKWLETGPLAGDDDGDGLPDWWEYEACSDPEVTDGSEDADWNGEANLAAYQAGRPGFVWRDADADTMHDGWEEVHGLDTLTADDTGDPDLDGVPNALEHAMLTNPISFDGTDPWRPAMGDPAAGTPLVLHLRTSQRSWARRARWESTPSLLTDSWQWLTPGIIIETGPGPLAVEETVIPAAGAAGAGQSVLRLGLLEE